MTIRIISRSGSYYVLSRNVLRTEAIRFFFNDGMQPAPTLQELYCRTPPSSTGIDIGDTHWALATNGFAARRDLYDQIRPDAWRQMSASRDLRDPENMGRPGWVPEAIWAQFMSAGAGVHRYSRASRVNTDIILIKRPGLSGYADMPTDLDQVRTLLGVLPQSTLSSLFTGENTDSARARWMVEANEGYNRYMKAATTQHNMDAGEALRSYRNDVYQRFLRAYLPLIGGSFAAHPAGGVGSALHDAGFL